MSITLRNDWQDKIKSIKSKVYRLGVKDSEVFHEAFDELPTKGKQVKSKLEYTSHTAPFSDPVFVAWKALANGKCKGRAVVDILGLNNLIVQDTYPVPLQTEIIASALGCRYISALDTISFFYQGLIYSGSRRLFTIITHRGQKTFNVPVMGCKGSVA